MVLFIYYVYQAFEGHYFGSFTARKRSTDVDELYELEKKRARVELQLAENRVAHENELFELKKAILEKNLEQVFSNSSIIPFNEL